MADLKIGFIGVGGVAQPHLQNLNEMEGVTISAVCDAFADRAQATGEKYGATIYTDYREMLSNEQLDGCYVCLIPAVHGQIEVDLVQKGIPFYVEKPVHLDLDACQRVLDALDKNPIVTNVGYHWRYTAASQALRDFTSSQRVSLVEGHWYGGFVGAPWWRQLALSGGQLVEQSTHIVDMARFLAGEVHTVYGVASTGAMTEIENYDIHDTSIISLQFDSGAVGQITSGCIAEHHGGSKVEINVKGRNWHAWTNASLGKITTEAGTREVDGGQDWSNQLGNGDHAFVRALRSGNGSDILSPYVSGVQTLALTLAANESFITGEPVKVRRFV